MPCVCGRWWLLGLPLPPARTPLGCCETQQDPTAKMMLSLCLALSSFLCIYSIFRGALILWCRRLIMAPDLHFIFSPKMSLYWLPRKSLGISFELALISASLRPRGRDVVSPEAGIQLHPNQEISFPEGKPGAVATSEGKASQRQTVNAAPLSFL